MEFLSVYDPMRKVAYDSPMPLAPADIERPLEPSVPIRELGASVTEGSRFGSLIQTATGAMRAGVGTIELATIQGGAEPGGAESYGKQAREALREVARANQIDFVSVHTPSNIGNLSGFNPQQGFSDEQRKQSMDEVKKAINLSADATGGGAVVVHTGEFQRRMSEAAWAKNPDGSYKFLGYEEEPSRAITYLVDERNGRIISDVRKSQIIREPIYQTAHDLGIDKDQMGLDTDGKAVLIRPDDWVDQDGRRINPADPESIMLRVPNWNSVTGKFETRKMDWDRIEERTRWYNERVPSEDQSTAEEMAFRIQSETRMLQYRGTSLYYSQRFEDAQKSRDKLKESLGYYENLEKQLPQDEVWKIMRRDPTVGGAAEEFVKAEYRRPSEIIKDRIRDNEWTLKHIREASAAADAQADETWDTIQHVLTMEEYAKKQTLKSYAEAGIYAMTETVKNPHATRDIFVAPENVFPEMGYGSHPEELIELIRESRTAMVDMLTKEKIPDPQGRRDINTGELIIVENPYFRSGISVEQAKKEANDHIKATFDTQHLGMWRKHFVPKAGESKLETDKRFHTWYMGQIKKMADEDIIGHIHLVDSMGGGHHHLPAGQGEHPVVDAVTYLKKRGFKGTIVSEGHEENSRFGQARQFTETWRAFGSPLYSTHFARAGGPTWPHIHHAYFGVNQPPMFIYGAYSPSNEWTLWSEVPME